MEAESTRSETGEGDLLLLGAATFFAAAVLVHGADHVRRGVDAISTDVFWIGTAAVVLQVALVVLACQRHRVASLTSAIGGFALALGYVVVHFTPERDLLSDSFVSALDLSMMSLVAATMEVSAALTLGVCGLLVLHRRGGLASAAAPWPPQRSFRGALVHPLSAVMIAGNLVILVVSFAQY